MQHRFESYLIKFIKTTEVSFSLFNFFFTILSKFLPKTRSQLTQNPQKLRLLVQSLVPKIKENCKFVMLECFDIIHGISQNFNAISTAINGARVMEKH